MFASLTSRIFALCMLVMMTLLALVVVLIDASAQTRESFRWVNHSAEVIETMGDALMELRDAESGQRGFVLTQNAVFAQTSEDRIAASHRAFDQVVMLTADNPVQNRRVRDVRRLADARIAVLRETLDLARHGDFKKARDVIANGRGRTLMMAVSQQARTFLNDEDVLQAARINAADRRLTWMKQVAMVGGPILCLMVLTLSVLIIRGIRRPVDVIRDAMTSLGHGDRHARITTAMGSVEFAHLASGYNAMADKLEGAIEEQERSERELHRANAELMRTSRILRDRGEAIEVLGGMAHRMQAARTDDELAQIIRVFVPRVLPGIPGALFAHNNSRNLLVPIASWGGLQGYGTGFAPDQCWALRRGQSHSVAEQGEDIVCNHIGEDDHPYHCEPLLAGGEVIGTLYLRGEVEADDRFRLTFMAENIASALVNHRLQRGLREQTIRDPLTGLFNRRYMQEALGVEIARATRSGAPLSLVMCDVDHFKRFNDDFGHDAGDAVLRAVASEMQSRFRNGDVVCRYGGEEFTIIAPGSTAEALAQRVEVVREAITRISLNHAGQSLGSVSMSFGIAMWEDGMNRDGSTLVQLADGALYRAKREGRNRAVVELRSAA